MYRVIARFTDNEDGHVYNVGDEYPRKGSKPSESRIRKLSTTANKRGIALIEEVVIAHENKADKVEKKTEVPDVKPTVKKESAPAPAPASPKKKQAKSTKSTKTSKTGGKR